jgi:hypothetical protein
MGIFERKPLLEVGVPIPQNKKEAVYLEYRWTRKYCETAGKVTLMFPELRDDTSKIVMRHGRENILLENEYLIKYKGNWGQLADY